MPEASFVHETGAIDYTPAAATDAGVVFLHPMGMAAVVLAELAANELGTAATEGQFDLASASGTVFAAGEAVWWDDTNNLAVVSGASTASFLAGRAAVAKVSGQTTVRVDLNATSGHGALGSTLIADSSAVTNTTTETVVGTLTIPANTLRIGNVVEAVAAMIATATNSTDTFRFRIRLGGVAGTVVADSTAIDLADNDTAQHRLQIVVRAIGASGSVVAASHGMMKTTASHLVVGATTVDTTAAITLVATITESVANAGNSAKLTQFVATIR
jgi:predicted RecA/RadA family phage recombinase